MFAIESNIFDVFQEFPPSIRDAFARLPTNTSASEKSFVVEVRPHLPENSRWKQSFESLVAHLTRWRLFHSATTISPNRWIQTGENYGQHEARYCVFARWPGT